MASRVNHQQPLVSIITPTLQRARLLERTLRSVAAQTYSNIEHIVVDGGSTDGTQDLLRDYAAKRSLRWISEADGGMYDAVNKGVAMSTGEFVAYLNSDDLLFPWSVEVAVKELLSRPDVDVVFGDLIRVDEVRGRVVPVFIPPFHAASAAAFGNLSQPATMIRRSVLTELGGFDASLRFVADADLWFRIAARHSVRRIPEFLAVELWHAEALSTASRAAMAAEDRRMRGPYRHGIWATRLGHAIARARFYLWSSRAWLRFAMARPARGGPWALAVEALRPRVSLTNALLGAIPSRGSRLRACIRWSADPVLVASGQAGD